MIKNMTLYTYLGFRAKRECNVIIYCTYELDRKENILIINKMIKIIRKIKLLLDVRDYPTQQKYHLQSSSRSITVESHLLSHQML